MKHHLLLYVVLSISFSQTVTIGNTKFVKRQFAIGKGQSSIAVADFNLDGNNDLVTVNMNDESVFLFNGDGKGNLIRTHRLNSGKSPSHVMVSDVNNDGLLDIVITNHETSYLTFFNGDGEGNFARSPISPLTITVDPHPHMAIAKDLNNDQRPDLIIDNRTHNGLLVLLGENDRFKLDGITVNVGGDPYRGFETVDVNNDGWLDIITPNANEISISLNKKLKTLSFERKKSIPLRSAFSVKLTDLNNDGFQDIIGASIGGEVVVSLGDGRGNFLDSKRYSYNMASGSKQIAVGDINGDGFNDALISCWNNELLFILGDKKAFKQQHFSLKEVPNPWEIELADLNADGKDDVLITDGINNSLIVLLSKD